VWELSVQVCSRMDYLAAVLLWEQSEWELLVWEQQARVCPGLGCAVAVLPWEPWGSPELRAPVCRRWKAHQWEHVQGWASALVA